MRGIANPLSLQKLTWVRIPLPPQDAFCKNMHNEIERKFFVREMPDLSGTGPLHYERYFLKREKSGEERISKINGSYFYESKTEISILERSRERKEINKREFNKLKQSASKVIIRDRYDISVDPKISVQIYHGRFEGLIRAEVEFETEEQAQMYTPEPWMG